MISYEEYREYKKQGYTDVEIAEESDTSATTLRRAGYPKKYRIDQQTQGYGYIQSEKRSSATKRRYNQIKEQTLQLRIDLDFKYGRAADAPEDDPQFMYLRMLSGELMKMK